MAAAGECGVDLRAAAAALSSAPMSPNRMSVRTTPRGVTLIDDVYNANPKSMAAALETLTALPARRRVAFVGVMAELKDPEVAHRAVAALARRDDIELIAVDTSLYGVDSNTLQSAIARVAEFGDGDAVLVKGSRIAGLERLVHAFG
jgi:UDP-N-acetylmuramoyl-tripeptide--D-alanyl-D-alanine ligase